MCNRKYLGHDYLALYCVTRAAKMARDEAFITAHVLAFLQMCCRNLATNYQHYV